MQIFISILLVLGFLINFETADISCEIYYLAIIVLIIKCKFNVKEIFSNIYNLNHNKLNDLNNNFNQSLADKGDMENQVAKLKAIKASQINDINKSSTTLKHYPMIKKKSLAGTARYASINALNGLTQSRRDDLEAVGYVLLYFLRGKLPWQGLHVKNKEERYHRIMEIKIETTPSELCKGFPKEFEEYINYTRNLEYEQDPDYEYLKNLFHIILKDDSEKIYDWDIENKTLNTITTTN